MESRICRAENQRRRFHVVLAKVAGDFRNLEMTRSDHPFPKLSNILAQNSRCISDKCLNKWEIRVPEKNIMWRDLKSFPQKMPDSLSTFPNVESLTSQISMDVKRRDREAQRAR
jgi:hypothetical protein